MLNQWSITIPRVLRVLFFTMVFFSSEYRVIAGIIKPALLQTAPAVSYSLFYLSCAELKLPISGAHGLTVNCLISGDWCGFGLGKSGGLCESSIDYQFREALVLNLIQSAEKDSYNSSVIMKPAIELFFLHFLPLMQWI